MIEARETFECFGSQCVVIVSGEDSRTGASAERAALLAREQLLAWHDQFSRFIASSELSRLNANTEWTVPVSPMMARLLAAVAAAGAHDRRPRRRDPDRRARARRLPPLAAGRRCRSRSRSTSRPAGRPPRPAAWPRWAELMVDIRSGHRRSGPPGVRVDSGGLAKGLFADDPRRAARPPQRVRRQLRRGPRARRRSGRDARRQRREPIRRFDRCRPSPTRAAPSRRAASAGAAGSTRTAPRRTTFSTRQPEAGIHRHRPGHGTAPRRRCSPRFARRPRCSPGPAQGRALAAGRRRRGLRRRRARRIRRGCAAARPSASRPVCDDRILEAPWPDPKQTSAGLRAATECPRYARASSPASCRLSRSG